MNRIEERKKGAGRAGAVGAKTGPKTGRTIRESVGERNRQGGGRGKGEGRARGRGSDGRKKRKKPTTGGGRRSAMALPCKRCGFAAGFIALEPSLPCVTHGGVASGEEGRCVSFVFNDRVDVFCW